MQVDDFNTIVEQCYAIATKNIDENALICKFYEISKISSQQFSAINSVLESQQSLSEYHNLGRGDFIRELQSLLQNTRAVTEPKNTTSFLDYFNTKNNKNIGISIINERGQFCKNMYLSLVLMDKLTSDILEIRKGREFAKTFFDYLCDHSHDKVKSQYQHSLMNYSNQTFSGKFTIYSPRTQKKCLKLIRETIDKDIVAKKAKKIKKGLKKDQITDEEEIYYKNLKTVEIKMEKVMVLFGSDFLATLGPRLIVSDQVKDNLNLQQQVAVMEMSESDKPENLTMDIMMSDRVIQSNEQRWQSKIDERNQMDSDH